MTPELIAQAAGKKVTPNLMSVVAGLQKFGDGAGLGKPHRLAHYLAQLMHESAGFVYDREIWGPTAAQKRYEGRLDLGNTQPGDGLRFAGKTGIQVTGRANHREFTAWVRKNVDPNAPDFEANPEALLGDPWEGIGPIWYWVTRKLNEPADQNFIEVITRRINGGLNGYSDRRRYYHRTALTMLGFGVTGVKQFQTAAGLVADGIAGQATEAAMHNRLLALPTIQWAPAAVPDPGPVTLSVEETLILIQRRLDGIEAKLNIS